MYDYFPCPIISLGYIPKSGIAGHIHIKIWYMFSNCPLEKSHYFLQSKKVFWSAFFSAPSPTPDLINKEAFLKLFEQGCDMIITVVCQGAD